MDEKEILWSERVAAWRASGQSMRKFALERGWTPRQLTYWARRLDEVPAAVPLLIPVTRPHAEQGESMRLTTAGGHRVDLPTGTPAAWLAELLRALA